MSYPIRPIRAACTFFLVIGFLSGTAMADITQQAKEKTYKQLEIFSNVLSILQENYVEEIDAQKALDGAIQGMLFTLDPHSSYLTPEEFQDLQDETSGAFSGVGIEITVKDGVLTVVSPIEGTPADKAGIKANDQIVEIEGKKTKEISSTEAIKKLRGPKGSKVTITIQREGWNEQRPFTLTRDIIPVQSVKAYFLTPGFAYIRITNFQTHTTKDFKQEFAGLQKKQAIRGLVLDLRNNPGGLLNQAVSISDIFLQQGTIVYTKGRTEDQNMLFKAHKTSDDTTVPMVVLVNEGSASASEIVAGAIQDHKRGVIVGTRTFGKGSVQTIIPLRLEGEGPAAIKLTTARYYTPNGRSIQAKGIVPDLVVEDTPEGNFSGFNVREADLMRHLESNKAEDAARRATTPAGAATQPATTPESAPATKAAPTRRYEFGSAEDFQLQQAMNHLKGKPVDVAKPKGESVAKAAPAR